MTFSKRVLLLSALLILATVATLYLWTDNQALTEELDRQRAIARVDSLQLATFEEINAVDSLLFAGRFGQARAAYRTLDTVGDDSLRSVLLLPRIDHVESVLNTLTILDTLRDRLSRGLDVQPALLMAPNPEPVRTLSPATANPNRVDSLSFALRKARIQIQNLESRLQRTSGPNYLTFTSDKGNEVYYVGGVKDGMANGRGVALFSTGSRYIGEWKDNKKHGRGEYRWPDGAIYEGEYRDGVRSGQGSYRFPKGDLFVGEWEADLRNGKGVFYDKKGKVVAEGKWEDDELVGN